MMIIFFENDIKLPKLFLPQRGIWWVLVTIIKLRFVGKFGAVSYF